MRPNRLVMPLAFLLALVPAAPAAGADWSASVGAQPDSWNSMGNGTNEPGTSYTHVFDTPGRYQYVCTPHRDFMKGVIEVGTDTVAKSVSAFKSTRSGKRVKVSFRLNEPAT